MVVSRPVTLQTIADLAGVSRITVSNAFSRPDQLSSALREKVLAIASELGYPGPHAAARILSRGRSDTIGVLFTDRLTYAFADPVATLFLAGVAEVIEEQELGLTVLSSPRGGSAGPVLNAVIDGLIVYSVDDDSEGLRAARQRTMPLVFVDQEPDPGISSVLVDDRRGAEEAARHLAELGHHRVALVLGGMGASTSIIDSLPSEPLPHKVLRDRLAGWLKGLGTSADLVVVNLAQHDRQHGKQAARLLLTLDTPPTAALCLSDEIARGMIQQLRQSGQSVPGGMSIVGFDDAPQGTSEENFLTTVAQPLKKKGELAARLLLERMDPKDGSVIPSKRILLSSTLVVRESTGPNHR